MQITFLTRKSALIYRRGLRQRVASLTLNCNGVFAIRAYGITDRENDIADSEKYVCCDGSSKENGGGQASILQIHLGSDIINLAETFIFLGRIVHILWPERP